VGGSGGQGQRSRGGGRVVAGSKRSRRSVRAATGSAGARSGSNGGMDTEVAGKSRDLGLSLGGGPGLDAIGQTVVPSWVGAVEKVVEHG
jgi:hypothetical protein